MGKINHIRIASRAGKLALVQSSYIKNLLGDLCDDVEISIVRISTKGDRDKSDFLHKSESVGFFTTEVEKALLNGRADVAVHSFKDLPTAETAGLVVAAVPKRESVADALVATEKVSSIEDLPAGAAVGTSSLRRIAQLKHLRDDLKCVPLRGNVETRVGKVMNGQIDAAVIACAGLNRLGMADKISAILPLQDFVPAPAQGALAVQIRTDDNELAKLVAQIEDKQSRITAETERHVLSTMQGGCSIPVGVYSIITGDVINIDAMICDVQGKRYIRLSETGRIDRAKACAEKLAEKLLAAGGQQILNEIRNGSQTN